MVYTFARVGAVIIRDYKAGPPQWNVPVVTANTSSVFTLDYGEGHEWLLPVIGDDFDALRFDGTPRRASWRPIAMRRLKFATSGSRLVPADFVSCSGGQLLTFGERAFLALASYLDRYGEVLPLACEESHFWTFNVTNLIPALDVDRSRVFRANDDGSILMIQSHEFHEAALGSDIWKLSAMPRGLIYVSAGFKKRVADAKLSGLEFEQVWPTRHAEKRILGRTPGPAG